MTPTSTSWFANPTGYALAMQTGTNRFEFTLRDDAPLTWHDGDGYSWQPDRHFCTDLGSVPSFVSWVPGYSPHRLAFLFHDSAYNSVAGHGHGLYKRVEGFYEFFFSPLTRRQADDLMRLMLISEGVRPSAARVIWLAVRAFGPRRW